MRGSIKIDDKREDLEWYFYAPPRRYLDEQGYVTGCERVVYKRGFQSNNHCFSIFEKVASGAMPTRGGIFFRQKMVMKRREIGSLQFRPMHGKVDKNNWIFRCSCNDEQFKEVEHIARDLADHFSARVTIVREGNKPEYECDPPDYD